MSRTKVLWVREPALQAILSGQKRVEVRVGYPNIRRLQPGDVLLLNERYPYRIRDIRVYPSHEALLAQEDPHAIAPHLPAEAILPTLRTLYPPEKEALGVYALEIEPVEPSNNQSRRS